MYVPRSVFSIAKCSGTKSSRYALGGIKLERNGEGEWPTAVVTDGRKLVAVQFQELPQGDYPLLEGVNQDTKPEFTTILPAKACQEAAKLCAWRGRSPKAFTDYVVLDEQNTNGIVPIGATNFDNTNVIRPRALEGRFPIWRDVFPGYDAKNSQSVCFDIDQMIGALTALKQSGAANDSKVTLTIRKDVWGKNEDGLNIVKERGDEYAMMITCTNAETNRRGVAIVMPCTGSAKEGVPLMPAWTINDEIPKNPTPEVPSDVLPKEGEEEFEDEEWEEESEPSEEDKAKAREIVASYETPLVASYETPLVALAPNTCKCAGCGKMVKKVFLTERKHKLYCPEC